MKMEQYLEESARTMSDSFCLSNREIDLLHAAIGLVTEIGELSDALGASYVDTVNVLEEAADINWYLAIFQRELQFILPTEPAQKDFLMFSRDYDNLRGMVKYSSNILDIMKKKAFYNREIPVCSLMVNCVNLQDVLLGILDFHKLSLETGLDNNIAKLRKRFPDKFNNENANVRDLDAERKELEKNL